MEVVDGGCDLVDYQALNIGGVYEAPEDTFSEGCRMLGRVDDAAVRVWVTDLSNIVDPEHVAEDWVTYLSGTGPEDGDFPPSETLKMDGPWDKAVVWTRPPPSHALFIYLAQRDDILIRASAWVGDTFSGDSAAVAAGLEAMIAGTFTNVLGSAREYVNPELNGGPPDDAGGPMPDLTKATAATLIDNFYAAIGAWDCDTANGLVSDAFWTNIGETACDRESMARWLAPMTAAELTVNVLEVTGGPDEMTVTAEEWWTPTGPGGTDTRDAKAIDVYWFVPLPAAGIWQLDRQEYLSMS